jgi:hypothetical protein
VLKAAKKYTDVLKDVVVLVPAIHLSLCFVYLYVYFASFGSSLALFTSPTDVFSVSFYNIAPFYAGILLQPLIMFVPLWNLEAEEEPSELKPIGVVSKVLYAIPVVWGFLVGLVYYSVTGFFPTFNFFLFAAMGTWWFARMHLRRKRPWRTPILIALFFALILLSFNAIKDGQRDRYYAVEEFKTVPRCGDVVVLRTLGDSFLALDQSGRRLIVDESCRTRFVIGGPRADFFPDNDLRQLAQRVRQKLGI